MIFAKGNNNAAIILIAIVGSVAVIAIVTFLIYKFTHPKLKNDQKKPDEKEIVEEELKRILKPIDDEEVAKELNEYKEKEDE